MVQPIGEAYISPEDQARIDAHEELLKENLGPCQYPGCEVASISHDEVLDANHEYMPPPGASKVLGDVDGQLANIVVADDVKYVDTEGNDVTDETINRNLEAIVTDTTVEDEE